MPTKIVLILAFCVACAQVKPPHNPHVPKDFPREKLILATQTLTKIFDKETPPLECVPDTDEASLLLRTIRPRMEVIQDDIEAMLDTQTDVDTLLKECADKCTCSYIDDVLREHQVILTSKQKKVLNKGNTAQEVARCQKTAREGFCKSELYQELNLEKADFSFDEEAP